MSTNNQLIILKRKQFEVHENSCVDDDFEPRYKGAKRTLLKKAKTFIEATKFANEYCKENYVEYGCRIVDSCFRRIKK